MGRSTMNGTPAYAQIEFLERRNAELEAENEQLREELNRPVLKTEWQLLKEENERLRVLVEKRGLPIDVFNDCERLKAENDQYKQDAKRYRWLRANIRKMYDLWYITGMSREGPTETDAAIDAAMKGGE